MQNIHDKVNQNKVKNFIIIIKNYEEEVVKPLFLEYEKLFFMHFMH